MFPAGWVVAVPNEKPPVPAPVVTPVVVVTVVVAVDWVVTGVPKLNALPCAWRTNEKIPEKWMEHCPEMRTGYLINIFLHIHAYWMRNKIFLVTVNISLLSAN